MRFATVRAPFCRDHGIVLAKQYLRRTLVEGWWGIFSPILNWFAIATDVRALRAARRLPFPVGTGSAAPGTSVLPAEALALVSETDSDRKSRRAVLRTVWLGIALGLATLIASVVTASDLAEPMSRRLSIHDALTLVLYAVVGVLVSRVLADGKVRPRLAEGSPTRSVTVGLGVGTAAALILVALNSLLSGHLVSDPRVVAVVFEGQLVHVAVIVFVVVVVAPVFEEVLFRGLLVESLRSRGRSSAVLGAAVAFAVWHLNPVALRYYVVLGFLLGYLYWRLGLYGSMSAHAAFNGVLVAAAVLSLAVGPAAVERAGARVEAPAGWVEIVDATVPTLALAVESPSGAALVVERLETGEGAFVSDPSGVPGAEEVRRVEVSGIQGFRFGTKDPDGVPSQIVVLPSRDGAWIVTLVPAGSDRAEEQLEQMLSTLSLGPS